MFTSAVKIMKKCLYAQAFNNNIVHSSAILKFIIASMLLKQSSKRVIWHYNLWLDHNLSFFAESLRMVKNIHIPALQALVMGGLKYELSFLKGIEEIRDLSGKGDCWMRSPECGFREEEANCNFMTELKTFIKKIVIK